jgi:hypothetical protein
MFEDMLRIVCGEGTVAADQQQHQEEEPDMEVVKEEEKPKKIETHTPSKYDNDIRALEEKYGNLEGKEIKIDLQTLLQLVPRERRRIDAYRGLLSYLEDKRNCKITITSRKTKV